MQGYVVIYEKLECKWQARSPDLPGCLADGQTLKEVEINFQVALEAHLEQLRLDNQPIPEPSADVRRIKRMKDEG